ncbi:ABC transporter permease [Paenibacillus sp. Marseille-Q4541]|uniref:ABC transporter permease n=1 Tax=Paenibacillus sp. Marseille-Q4541 TaxID=2831522 RepID=UPI001BA46424|nr:ABC transporter permease [Paenibacillus sp. Marseille-Q4541]
MVSTLLELLASTPKAIELGLLYGLMALGVYITFRILDFPDLTVDQSFTTGGAIASVMITAGHSPWVATLAAFGGGIAAGACTGLLHTKGKINGLLSGILMMIALYSINMRILKAPNVSLINTDTIFTGASTLLFMIVVSIVVILLLDVFFKTNLGLALRATGDNERMIRSFGANTDTTKLVGISLSNGLVALSGSFIAQHSGFADISMGIGMIVIGLASVIIGEAIIGKRSIFWAIVSVIIGSVVYRIVVMIAYRIEWLETSDLKIITAVIVILALLIPSAQRRMKQKKMAKKRTATLLSGSGKADKSVGGGL